MTERVYARMLAYAAQVLAAGRSVVVDASCRTRAQRDMVRALAAKLSVTACFIECRASREATMERLALRARGPSVSDGRGEIFDAFAATYEASSELAPQQHIALDTTRLDAVSFADLAARIC